MFYTENLVNPIPIYLNVNNITKILETSDTYAWSLFLRDKQGFLYI